ncbi:hydrolase [Hypoxylon crocopeplum]|nr:hydrolase [Hypoxylon crocopeplum]
MCQHHSEEPGSSSPSGASLAHGESGIPLEPFPWDIGVFDAHCHPTDTMASVASIPAMKARALTVMSTRSQDQELVLNMAFQQGVKDRDTTISPASSEEGRIVPSFGWHPWFSYQLYDDTTSNSTYGGSPPSKISHYEKILTPSPSSKDESFIEGLPDPRPLSNFLAETKSRLEKHPLALIGEIGLDRSFRLPLSWTLDNEAQRDGGLTPGSREGRRLSQFKVHIAHQVTILEAQLRLAGQMGRAVSVHGVQAPSFLYDTITKLCKEYQKTMPSKRQQKRIAEGAEDFSSSSEDEDEDENDAASGTKRRGNKASLGTVGLAPRPYPPRICMHSFGGRSEAIAQYLRPSMLVKVYFSFSIAINWESGGGDKAAEAIRVLPDDRILVESDLHVAGEQMDRRLEEVCRKVCEIKGWDLREGVEQLGRNWRVFIFG